MKIVWRIYYNMHETRNTCKSDDVIFFGKLIIVYRKRRSVKINNDTLLVLSTPISHNWYHQHQHQQ